MMKSFWTFTLLLCLQMAFAFAADAIPKEKHNPAFAFEAEMVKHRFLQMESIISPQYTKEVEAYLRAYLTYGRRDSEHLLGLSKIYFPIIDYHTRLEDMPSELKFLPVIESSLTPYAVSTAGAAGLWQLRRSLARHYGLKINYYVDERKDPYKSTDAALKYLKKLYKRFGSWELALAAYNCGPTRVARAIATYGTRDFWKLKKYLPRETANFIPRFLAASYIMNYYYLHGLEPKLPDAAVFDAKPVQVYERMTFSEIAALAGVDRQMVKKLNPAYVRYVVPQRSNVILPQRAAIRLEYHKLVNQQPLAQGAYMYYTVKRGDWLSKIALRFNCSVQDIKSWNDLNSDLIIVGQQLKIVEHKATIRDRV